ncbi:MAG: dTMP kinase [Treponema sp.]|jgi:dTMP kinase|nr:dTMP kinase [Treponema sp.]
MKQCAPIIIIPNFVVFEGGDGSGTSTQLAMIQHRFDTSAKTANAPLPVLYTTFEPTHGPVGHLLRSALRGDHPLGQDTLALLFAADRNEHVYATGGILDRCGRGELVISDRYVLSSLVYQGIACGGDLPEGLNAHFPAPEVLFFFDIDPEIARKRMETRQVKEIYEYLDFQIKVREAYKALLPRYGDQGVRVEIIDASQPPEAVAETVWRGLEKMPIMAVGGTDGSRDAAGRSEV